MPFDHFRDWTGTHDLFLRGGARQNLDGPVGLTLYFSMANVRKRCTFFLKKVEGSASAPSCYVHAEYKYFYFAQVNYGFVNGLHFPEIYTLRPNAALSVSEQHSHAVSGFLVPWKNVPSNLCWFRCSELHVLETLCQAVTLPSGTGFVGLSGLGLGRCLLQGLLHRKCNLYLLKGNCAFIFYSNHEKLLFF